MIVSKLKYLRIAPRKVRLVAALIRRKKVNDAQKILQFTIKNWASPMLGVLNTAISDAKNNFQLEENNLYIKEVRVDGGPINKRWRARSRGMAAPIQKKTSHITITLDEIEKGKKTKKVVEQKPLETQPEIKEVKKDDNLPKADQSRTGKAEALPKPVKKINRFKRFFRRKSI